MLEVADRSHVLSAARLALDAIRRPYPFHLLHLVRDPADVRAPQDLHPSFHGAFDWHSAVHGHWCVARSLRVTGDPALAGEAGPALERSFAPERLAGEAEYVGAPGREGFERPYGLAWVLQLAAELREWGSPAAARWGAGLAPLEQVASAHLAAWLPKLARPVRSGEHSQTAFALGLALDWARGSGSELGDLIERRARHFYGADRDAPIDWEPSGHDFLSPALGAADLMRRVLEPGDFSAWLAGFLPDLEGARARRWLECVASTDPADGKLAHLGGLNLSRAWMLEGVGSALDPGDPRRSILARAADRHREAGLAALGGGHYAGTHWLGSFAVYLLTRRGIS
jgi:hypothetical protein